MFKAWIRNPKIGLNPRPFPYLIVSCGSQVAPASSLPGKEHPAYTSNHCQSELNFITPFSVKRHSLSQSVDQSDFWLVCHLISRVFWSVRLLISLSFDQSDFWSVGLLICLSFDQSDFYSFCLMIIRTFDHSDFWSFGLLINWTFD